MHDHEHSHDHHHHSIDTPEKLKALIEHMLHHNESHTDELEEIIELLKEHDKPDTASYIEAAVTEYNDGNKLLQKALSSFSD